jgi:hypothetical protein
VGLSYRVVFASTLSAVHAFLGESVTYALQRAAFAELAADEVVDAVLGFVDGLDAGDFGLVESVYRWKSVSVFNSSAGLTCEGWDGMGTYP